MSEAISRTGEFLTRARILTAALLLVLVAVPFYLDEFWMQLGVFTLAAAVGAIGLTIQVGVAGQFSLAHALFLGSGAYLYAFLAGSPEGKVNGLGWPTALAALGAVFLSGLLGAAFSPMAGRVRGLYLAVASIGLVFLGQHLLTKVIPLSGGPAGRAVPPLSLGGFEFSDSEKIMVLGIPFGGLEKLWFLGLVVVVVGYVAARRIVDGRPGLAMNMMRESEIGAAAMGVRVGRAKAGSFVLAAVYGSTAGLMLALASQWIVPHSFGYLASVDYLAMVIIGGMGSVRGAVAGAAFVTALPLLLSRHTDSLPFLSGTSGNGGIDGTVFATLLYAALLILVIMFAPGGLNALLTRITGRPENQRRHVRRGGPQSPDSTVGKRRTLQRTPA
ncbi:branched-chain amino acid ABC transporter permease [Streptomyces sp. NPDC056817]|uniref:branched-chain amino acid ABC transporter permease n=1 Tax=Streptomyces sp. NPDC056817 TaxID=3345950 RepID=UPI0036BC839B